MHLIMLAVLCGAAPAGDHSDAGLSEEEVAVLTRRWFAAYDAKDIAQMTSLEVPGFQMQVTAVTVPAKRLHDNLASTTLEIESRSFADEHVTAFPQVARYQADMTFVQRNALATRAQVEQFVTAVWLNGADGWKLFQLDALPGGDAAKREYWNERYRAGTAYNPKPNKLLMETIAGRKVGRALDVAMGEGRNAIALAEKGWDVTGVDIAEVGVSRAMQTARERGLHVTGVIQDTKQYDFGKDRWDLIAFIYAGGDEEVPRVKAALRSGGLVVVEWFRSHGKPIDWRQLYAGWNILKYEEVEDVADWGLSKDKLVRFVAQKP